MDPQKTSKSAPGEKATSTPTATPQARPTIRLHLNSTVMSSGNTPRQSLPTLPAVGSASRQAVNAGDNNAIGSLTPESQPGQQTTGDVLTSGLVGNEQHRGNFSFPTNTPSNVLTLPDEHLQSDHVLQLLEVQQYLLSDWSLLQGEFYDETLPEDNPQNVVFHSSGLNSTDPLFEFESRLKKLFNRFANRERVEVNSVVFTNSRQTAPEREEYEACYKILNEKRDQMTALRTYLEGDDGHSYPVPVVYKMIGNQLRAPSARPKSRRQMGKQAEQAPVVESSPGPAVSGSQRSSLGNLGRDEMSGAPSRQCALLTSLSPAPSLTPLNLLTTGPPAAFTTGQHISTPSPLPSSASLAAPQQLQSNNLSAEANNSITTKRKSCGARSSSDGSSDHSQPKPSQKKLKRGATNGNMGSLIPSQSSTPNLAGQASPEEPTAAASCTHLPANTANRTPLPPAATIANRTPAPRGYRETRAELTRMNEEFQRRITAMQQRFATEASNAQRLLDHATFLLGHKDGQVADLSARILTLSNENTQLKAEVDRLQRRPAMASNARAAEEEVAAAKEDDDTAIER